MKQNVRFQEGICSGKIQPDQFQNDQISAIFDSNMHNIWQIVVVNKTITVTLKQVVVILDRLITSTKKALFWFGLVCCLSLGLLEKVTNRFT